MCVRVRARVFVISSNDCITGESCDFVFHALNIVRAKSEFVNWYLSRVCVRETGSVHVHCSGKACYQPRHYLHPQNNTYGLAEISALIQKVPLHRILLGLVCGVL